MKIQTYTTSRHEHSAIK